jgi:tetratricopeptide (TPR) repeat protein
MVETDARKYRAFISYSHADTSWAKWLHRRLEGFRIDKDLQGRETPTGSIPQSLRPIFRDRDDFTAGHTLTDQTLAALDASHALIVICSPAAAKSRYVTEEIRLFKSRHPDRPVIPLIVDGKPGDADLECFPPSLRFKLNADGGISDEPLEVLAADAREEGDGKNLAVAKVVAGLLAVSSDEVFRRAERERRRQGRIRNGIAGAIAALVLIGGFFGWQAQQSQQRLSEIESLVARYSFVGTAEAAVPGAKQSLTDAITSIAEGAARDPRYAKALDLLKAGKPEEAEPLLAAVAEDKKKAAATQNKAAAEAYRNLAAIAAISETQKARTYYAEAAALDPDNVEGTYYHGWFQLQAGSLSDAEAAFQRIVGNAKQGNEIWRFWSRIGIGDIHQDRGDLAAALDEYRAASEMAKPMAEADPEWQRGLAIVYGAIGDILMRQGQFADALTYYRDKTEIAYRIVEADQESVLAQNDLAVAVLQLGKALELQDKREEALKAYQASVALFQRLITVDPENVHWQQSLSAASSTVGDTMAMLGRLDDAMLAYRLDLVISERLAEADPDNAKLRHSLYVSRQKIGELRMRQGDLDEALTAFREGLAVAENLAEADPHNADWQRSLSDSFNSIGEALMAQGKLGEALEYLHKGLAVSDRLAEAHPNHPDAQAGLATSHANIGLVLMLRGEAASARQSLREARLVVVRLKDQGTDVTSILELYEAALSKLEAAAMSLEEKDAGAAGDALQQARDLFAKIKELSPGDDAFLARLDAAIVNLRKTIAAEPDVADPTPSAD